MDNLTHSLIGAALARALPAKYRKPEFYWASVLANNLPDADFVVRFWPGTKPLDYLVHHRGYTHTFLLAPVLALAAAAIAKRIARADRWAPGLYAVALAGCLLHIGADFMNNYGVHPLTPFLNRWYYGDSVFIVEPLLWFTLIPFVAQEAVRRWARVGWWITAAAMVALVWVFPLFSSAHALVLTLLLAAVATLQRKTRSRWTMIAASASVVAGFVFAGFSARSAIEASWGEQAPGERKLDISSTPAPGDPLCWSAWIASRDRDRFVFRSVEVALLPSLHPVDRCPAATPPSRTADLIPEPLHDSEAVRWENRYSVGVEEWNRDVRESCELRKLLSFVRFPFVRRMPDGTRIAGDLRYDREKGVGFAETVLPGKEDCSVPDTSLGEDFPWEPPFTSKLSERG
jgi:inner membrane protein